MSGRLTLSWANKDRSLVSTEDGGYEWVDPDDPRAIEVRLLDVVGSYGDQTLGENLLILGDGLQAMRSLARIPEYAERYRGKVKLVYIDPPFNTGQAFEHYDDALEHSVWLGMMRERLEAIRDLLAPDGSVWVHLDDAEMAYCKVLMDEIFGRQNFVATVVWQKVHGTKNSAVQFSVDQDYVIVYSRRPDGWRPNGLARSASMDARYSNPDLDERGPWTSGDLAARNPYSLGRYSIVTPTGRVISGPPAGSYWRVSAERLAELDADGRIWWGPDGTNVPRLKRFLSEVKADKTPQTWWGHAEVGHTQEAKKEIKALFPEEEPFSTPKPERLLERIIHVGSNPGDIVLDAFAGSGTTAAVAHKMRRRWVTIEQQASTVEMFTRPRLAKVIDGVDLGGVTASTGWTGGGGFTELRVAPAMYRVIVTDEFRAIGIPQQDVPDAFARSVAAQLGYHWEGIRTRFERASPIVGRKGRARLAVVEGVADAGLVDGLVTELDDGETLLLAATMAAPGTAQTLRERHPGSRLILIPHDLFRRGAVA